MSSTANKAVRLLFPKREMTDEDGMGKRVSLIFFWMTLLLLIFSARSGQAATILVPSDSPTIQQAINYSVNGDTVIVSPGTYMEKINFLGKSITVTSEGGPESTVIDGDSLGTVVTFESGEKLNSVLKGFTLRKGKTSFGAGIKMWFSSATITGNIIDSNIQTAGGFGAGIAGNGSSPIIEKNLFLNNSCDNQFLSGVVSFVNGSSPRIVNNIFTGNPCRAINMTIPVGNSPEVSNNTIVGNSVGVRVDARISTVSQLYRNNIIVGNDIGLEVDFGSLANNPTWKNNLISNNLTNYMGISDQTGTNGNISVDPLFTDQPNADYHLKSRSPAIDAGDNSAPNLPITDYDGAPRIFDGDRNGVSAVDMGAYENMQYKVSTAVSPEATGSISPDCSAGCLYISGSLVPLLIFPNTGYVFSAWSGDCGASMLNTQVFMDIDRTCTANLVPCGTDPAKNSRSDFNSTSIQDLYDDLVKTFHEDTLWLMATGFTGAHTFDRDISITLEGGYNCDYSGIVSNSIIRGMVTINDGKVTIKGIIIQ